MPDERLREYEREWAAGGDPEAADAYDRAWTRAGESGASPPRSAAQVQLTAVLRRCAIRCLRVHVGLGCTPYEAELVLNHFTTVASEVPSGQMLGELVLGIRLHRLGQRMRGAQDEALNSIVSVQPMSTPRGVVAYLDANTNTERAEALESFFPAAGEESNG